MRGLLFSPYHSLLSLAGLEYKTQSWLFFGSQKGTALSTMILMVLNSAESLREGLLFPSGMKFTSLPFFVYAEYLSVCCLTQSKREGIDILVQVKYMYRHRYRQSCRCMCRYRWGTWQNLRDVRLPRTECFLNPDLISYCPSVVLEHGFWSATKHGRQLPWDLPGRGPTPSLLRRVHSTLQRAGGISSRGLTPKQKILALALSHSNNWPNNCIGHINKWWIQARGPADNK